MTLENINEILIVTESPHVRGKNTTSRIMLDVCIALIPALLAGTMVFGYRALAMAMVCMLSAVGFEWLWCRTLKKPDTTGDFSAVVTGLLIALNVPVSLPYWMAIIGTGFAIIIVKQFFGGIGHNFMNPAMAARAFLLISWAGPMTSWVKPFSNTAVLFPSVDAMTSATPLTMLKEGAVTGFPSYLSMFLGQMGGCIGEVSALAILIGAAYLLIRRVISIRIPAAYLLTFSLLIFILGGKNGLFTGDALRHLLSGGVMLGAFFMATDYVTTPYTKKGQIVFGIGCGIITAIVRLYGGYPEGASYAILLMNVVSPLIDKFTAPKRFGAVKAEKAKGGDC